MPAYPSDIFIKTLRVAKGLTQSQLAEGICTRDTISRIERGERFPDWYTFKEILLKLGQKPELYYNSIITYEEKDFLEKAFKIEQYVREKNFFPIEKLLSELGNNPLIKFRIYKQHFLHIKAVYLIGQNIEINTAHSLLIEAIKVNRHNFDETNIDSYVLTEKEILILNSLAITYNKKFGMEKALEILLKLKKSMENVYFDQSGENDKYRLILSNIAYYLRLLKRFKECAEICDLGLMNTQRVKNMDFIQKFNIMKSICLYSEGKKAEGIAMFEKTCHLYIGLDYLEEMRLAVDFFKNEFNVSIEWIDDFIKSAY